MVITVRDERFPSILVYYELYLKRYGYSDVENVDMAECVTICAGDSWMFIDIMDKCNAYCGMFSVK
jgi:hypothetical protein